jgi:hypothetical protein
MDVTSHKFYRSIFSKIKNIEIRLWFNSTESWRLKYEWYDNQIVGRRKWNGITIPVQITDAWHFFKMLMIVFICGAIVLYEPIVNTPIDFMLAGVVWNVVFSFHYNITFRL